MAVRAPNHLALRGPLKTMFTLLSTSKQQLAARLRHISSYALAVLVACVLAVASPFVSQTAHAISFLIFSPGTPGSAYALPAGQVGVQEYESITTNSTHAPVQYTIDAGSLPGGVTLISGPSNSVIVFGLPTTAGSFAFTVKALDALSTTGSQAYTLVITRADTSTDLTATPSTGHSLYGDNVQFTGTVTTAPTDVGGIFDDGGVTFGTMLCNCPDRLPVTTGSVKFMDGGAQLAGDQTVNGSGVVTFSTTALTPGVHPITAVYSAPANYDGSTSNVFVQTVQQIISFGAVANKSYGAASSALTATANSGLAVTFASTTPDVCATSGTDGGTLTILDIGTCTIVASQSGNSSYVAAATVTRTFTVTSAPLTIKADNAGRVYGAPSPVFSATYIGLVNNETSAVLGGALVLVTNATDTSGPGAYSVTPSGSTSTRYTVTFTAGTLTIARAITGIVLTPSTTTLVGGQSVVVTAQLSVVAPGVGTPTGSVTFVDGASTLGSAVVTSAGLATFTTTLTLDGTPHNLIATYVGDANFEGSASSPVALAVAQAVTTTTLGLNRSTSTVGDTVSIAAAVASSTPGVPTGNLVFLVDGSPVGTVSLDGTAQAVLDTSTLGAGTHAVTARYAGDAHFGSSVSAPTTLVISQAAAAPPASTGGGGGGSHSSRPAPTPVPAPANAGGAAAAPLSAPQPAVAAPAAPAVPPPPAPAAPPAQVVQAPPAPVPAAPAPEVPPSSVSPGPAAPPSLTTFDGVTVSLGQLGIQPAAPADFQASVPDSLRIEVHGAAAPLVDNLGTAPQVGALGGGNAVRIAPPVDLNLVARELASNNEVALPDGALEQTYLVSLPVLAQPADPNNTFTWLVEVQEDGQFLGYMRYPSTFDAATNTLVYELPAHLLIDSSVLPVILVASQVQTFLPDVHGWSSPFSTGGDFGIMGTTWTTYAVLAPQVGGRIGVREPSTGELIWIDASGVGPTDSAASPPPDATPPPDTAQAVEPTP
jgi:hypothetical protein